MAARDYRGSGKLDTPARVVEFRRGGAGAWQWAPVRDIWTEVEYTQRFNIFSTGYAACQLLNLALNALHFLRKFRCLFEFFPRV